MSNLLLVRSCDRVGATWWLIGGFHLNYGTEFLFMSCMAVHALSPPHSNPHHPLLPASVPSHPSAAACKWPSAAPPLHRATQPLPQHSQPLCRRLQLQLLTAPTPRAPPLEHFQPRARSSVDAASFLKPKALVTQNQLSYLQALS